MNPTTMTLKRTIIVSILCVVAFTGCEIKSCEQAPATPTPVENPTPAIDFGSTDNKINVTFWFPFGNTDAEKFYQSMATKYSVAHPHVTITTISKNPYSFYQSELGTKLHTDEGPDVYLIKNGGINKFVKSKLVPIPDDALRYPSASDDDVYQSASELAEVFLPSLREEFFDIEGGGEDEEGEVKEKLYGVPLMYQGLSLFINKKIFDEYNSAHPNAPISIPSSTQPMGWGDFGELAIKLNRTRTGWINLHKKTNR